MVSDITHNIFDMVNKHANEVTIEKAGWRIQLCGKFIPVRSGNDIWASESKAISAFKAYVRNEWTLLSNYVRIRDGKDLPWNELRENYIELGKELSSLLILSGKVKFVEVFA